MPIEKLSWTFRNDADVYAKDSDGKLQKQDWKPIADSQGKKFEVTVGSRRYKKQLLDDGGVRITVRDLQKRSLDDYHVTVKGDTFCKVKRDQQWYQSGTEASGHRERAYTIDDTFRKQFDDEVSQQKWTQESKEQKEERLHQKYEDLVTRFRFTQQNHLGKDTEDELWGKIQTTYRDIQELSADPRETGEGEGQMMTEVKEKPIHVAEQKKTTADRMKELNDKRIDIQKKIRQLKSTKESLETIIKTEDGKTGQSLGKIVKSRQDVKQIDPELAELENELKLTKDQFDIERKRPLFDDDD